jgi:ribosome-binding protein aMBF1 (putative translation factor)
MARTTDALKIIDGLVGEDARLRAEIGQEFLDSQVARMIYEARTRAGLSREQLADLVGTKPSTIASLECSNDRGPSLSMLRRIAAALDGRIEVRFIPSRSA